MGNDNWVKVSTIVTGAAAVVALFQEPVRRWWARPTLEVTAQPKYPDCLQVTQAVHGMANPMSPLRRALYIRIRVTNSGRSAANRVEVYAHQLDQWNNGS
jgi:hypothetical protein